MSLSGICILLAVIVFFLATFGVASKINLVALGLALLALAQLVA